MRLYHLKVYCCADCPGTEYGSNRICSEMHKDIPDFIFKITTPDWCPLPDKESQSKPTQPKEIEVCPGCGKKAVKWFTGKVYSICPQQKVMQYRCGCGWKSEEFTEQQLTNEEIFKTQWEAANNPPHIKERNRMAENIPLPEMQIKYRYLDFLTELGSYLIITVCHLKYNGEETIGLAFNSPADQFNKKIGRDIARGRAQKALKMKSNLKRKEYRGKPDKQCLNIKHTAFYGDNVLTKEIKNYQYGISEMYESLIMNCIINIERGLE